jgi:transposase
MKAYSPDLRSRIVDAVEAGMSKAEAARRFDVGLSTVKRYVRRKQVTGSLDPTPPPGRIPTIRPHHLEALRAQVTEHAAAYLDEHCALWEAACGVRMSTSTMGRTIRRAGFTRKKGRWVPVNGTR